MRFGGKPGENAFHKLIWKGQKRVRPLPQLLPQPFPPDLISPAREQQTLEGEITRPGPQASGLGRSRLGQEVSRIYGPHTTPSRSAGAATAASD